MLMGVAAARAAPGQSIGMGGGFTVPTGDLSDLAGTGFHVGGAYTYRVGPQFGLGGDVAYHSLGAKEESGYDGMVAYNVKLTTHALQAGLHARLYFTSGSKTEPYLKLGVGLYNIGQKAEVSATDGVNSASASQTVSESKVGLSAGFGLAIGLNDQAALGIEAQYHLIPSSDSSKLATSIKTDSGSASSINLFTLSVSYNFLLAK